MLRNRGLLEETLYDSWANESKTNESDDEKTWN